MTGPRPTVSVVITTKDRISTLRQAIDSVLPLDRATFHIELVVVDDGSSDGTAEYLASIQARTIRTDGVGMARARNLGLRAATGDFVTLLDDDDVWLPRNIECQLEAMARHPEFAAVHAQSILTDHELRPSGAPVPYGPLPSGHVLTSLLGYFPQVATVLTRMEAAREAGDFDESLTGDTDWDWLLRIARSHPIGCVEEPVMLFRQRPALDEKLAWRRFPAMVKIFHRHTAALPLLARVRLRPVLWRHRGQWAWDFADAARRQWRDGQRRRSLTTLGYAARCSVPHTGRALLMAVSRRREEGAT